MVSLNALPIGPNAFSPEILRNPWDDFRLSPGQRPDRAAEHAHDMPFLFRNTGNEEFITEDAGQPAQLLRFNLNWIYVSEAKMEETISAYEDRIKVLKIQAAQEGYVLNRASETTFLAFFGKNLFLRFGRLFLMENGNLRAVWKDENGTHIGLQFLGNGFIQYVIFKHREPSLPMSRVCGRDTIDGIRRQIAAFDLDDLLYDWQ